MQQLFYCQKDGGQAAGPYTWPEIQELRTQNAIQDDTPIRQEHCDTWVPYHRIVVFVKPPFKLPIGFPGNPAFAFLCFIAAAWALLGLWSLFISCEVEPQAFSMSISALTHLSVAAVFLWLASVLKWFVDFLQAARKLPAESSCSYLHLIAMAWGILVIWTMFATQDAPSQILKTGLVVLSLFSAAAFFLWLASILKWLAVFVESSYTHSSRPACALLRLTASLWIMAGIWTLFTLSKSSPQALSTYIIVLGFLSTALCFYWLASLLKCLVILVERRTK